MYGDQSKVRCTLQSPHFMVSLDGELIITGEWLAAQGGAGAWIVQAVVACPRLVAAAIGCYLP